MGAKFQVILLPLRVPYKRSIPTQRPTQIEQQFCKLRYLYLSLRTWIKYTPLVLIECDHIRAEVLLFLVDCVKIALQNDSYKQVQED